MSKSISKSIKKWGLFGIGTTVLTASIPDNNFKFDDTNCKLILHIDNTNGKVSTKESKIKVVRIIEFVGKLLDNYLGNYTEEKTAYPDEASS